MAPAPERAGAPYRPDIDGLRAVAVLAVIVNHFQQSLLPGGFLGVDVFFVISGFVVTSSLIEKQPRSAKEFLTGFYSRRVKRLLPALIVTILFVGAAAIIFVPASGISLLTMMTALFGASNIYLVMTGTNYFALSPSRNLFAHSWSLGVEEQFYLLYPILLWALFFRNNAARNRRRTVILVGVAGTVSLLFSLAGQRYFPTRDYYLMPSRLWELATGALVCLAVLQNDVEDRNRGRGLISFLALLVALIGMMYAPAAWRFPVSICVVVLTAGLLAVAGRTRGMTAILTPDWGAYLGRLSYSMYLWHWPMLYFATLLFPRTWQTLIGVTALCIAVSALQYAFVEQPFREKKWPHGGRVIATGFAAAALCALGIGSVYRWHQHAMEARGFDYTYNPIEVPHGLGLGNRLKGDRQIDYARFDIAPVNAFSGTIWVIGDSTAESMIRLFESARDKLGYGTKYLTARCIPFTRYIEKDENGAVPFCASFNRLVTMRLPSIASRGDIVFIAHIDQFRDDSPPGTYFEDASGAKVEKSKVVKDVMRNASSLIRELSAHGVRSVYMLPTPFMKRYAGECYPEQIFRVIKISDCEVRMTDYLKESSLLRGSIIRMAANVNGLTLLDPVETLCPTGECLPYSDTGLNLYRDNYHLSGFASMLLMKPFFAIVKH